jgi:penicillin-binding protein 1A
MRAVVTDGTGKRAALDFTIAVGKSGTSSSYRDAWFMGFTGALVAGVWMGYDDYRPMPGITGGSTPAQIWHNFMSVALNGYRNIPPIAGLPGQPNEAVEQARFSQSKRADPGLAAEAPPPVATQKKTSLMSDQTRDALRRLSQSLRRAAGLEATPPAVTPATGKQKPPDPKAAPAPVVPERRAQASDGRGPRP